MRGWKHPFFSMEAQQKLIESLIEKPSVYSIDALDRTMLPKKLRGKKQISFTVRPPSLETLAKCVVPIMEIPENVREAKEISIEQAIPFREQMAQCFAIMAHGKQSEVPAWYVPFILNNVTPKELYQLFYECSLKLQSDFFLTSLKIASQNPMMMKK